MNTHAIAGPRTLASIPYKIKFTVPINLLLEIVQLSYKQFFSLNENFGSYSAWSILYINKATNVSNVTISIIRLAMENLKLT